jgi:lysophospholipase L1-like esterase
MARRRTDLPWKAIAVGGAVFGVLGAAVLVGSKKRSASLGVSQRQRIALIGDSYAVGLGPELAKLLPDFRGEGHVGTNTAQWANHAAACGTCGDWLPTFRPALVLVSLGVNDGNAPNPTNYQTLVQALHGIGARVVWIEPPAGVSAPEVRTAIASLGVQTVPATRTPLGADGLHPAGTGYQTWAREIATAIT